MNEEIKLESTSKGTRLITGELAKKRRAIINYWIKTVEANGYNEIVLPSIEKADLYTDKAGPEVLGQMYTFLDKSNRVLCLRPEGTATCQQLARDVIKYEKDVRLWYLINCWRYEQPQAGRYREFTQFGVEILNPTKDYTTSMIQMIETAMFPFWPQYELTSKVKRGFSYYEDGEGFEVSIPELGTQRQVLGGGKYKEGIGFAIGIDRLMLLQPAKQF